MSKDNQVELEALVWHPYGTGYREKGERYTATAADADVLVSLGRAKRVSARAASESAAAQAPAGKTATKSAGKAKR